MENEEREMLGKRYVRRCCCNLFVMNDLDTMTESNLSLLDRFESLAGFAAETDRCVIELLEQL